jgi:hypothetical protein
MTTQAAAASLLVLSLSVAAGTASAADRCQPAAGGEASDAARTNADARHFVVLAARSGVWYDQSGPAFAMVMEVTSGHARVEAVGISFIDGRPVFGQVPAAVYREFMTEPRRASDVLLRLEIGAAQYERTARILRTWDRRAREDALLYPEIAMDNILLVKQVTEGLNECEQHITLYALDWGLEDEISENNQPSNVPFKYFRELRRLNESRHVPDGRFPARHF